MLKKTVTYVDFKGVTRTEDFYFNLSRTEIIQMEARNEGLQEKLERLSNSPNGGEIMRLVSEILLTAYGEKSEDGRRFVKSEEISKGFSETPAYDAIFVELVTDAKYAAEFIQALLPDTKGLQQKLSESQAELPPHA